MKKIIAIPLVLAVIMSMASCGNNNDNAGREQPTASVPTETVSTEQFTPIAETDSTTDDGGTAVASETPEEQAENGSNILVAYFSRVGNTDWEDGVDAVSSASIIEENGEFVGNAEVLAEMAQQMTGGDLFLIETTEKYPSDYRKTTDVAKEEQNKDARPELASHVDNMDAYDTVVLVYPNWWGTLPQPLFTFLEEYDFSEKTILPLCTHGGSRMGSSEKDIADLCPDAKLLSGLAVSGSSAASSKSEVEKWISNSGILR
ncbi:MAG: flavodoxin [Oscillospiraceae bacterium]|nr:flavodoxin [Oscillospiraceae bacterium]